MSISVGEFGYPWRLSTNGLDMSSFTGFELNFTKPDDSTLQKDEASANPVSAPAVALVNDPDLGSQSASTYLEFTPVVADFDQEGTWNVCAFVEDATRGLRTQLLDSNGDPIDYTFEVGAACS